MEHTDTTLTPEQQRAVEKVYEAITQENRGRRLRALLERIGADLRSLDAQRKATEIDLGEVLRAAREHNESLPGGERDPDRVPITLAEELTGLSRPTLYKHLRQVPPDPADEGYRPEDVPLYSNRVVADLYRRVGDDDPAVEREFSDRWPHYHTLNYMIDQLHEVYREENPDWLWKLGDDDEPAWLRRAHDVRREALDRLRKGILAGDDA